MQKILPWLKNKYAIGGLILVVVIGGYWYNKNKSNAQTTQYITGNVVKSTITTSVSGSGQVAAENELDVKPSGSAKITEVDVTQGQAVKAGQRIAVLDETSASNSVTQARASLSSAQANYDSVLAGTTDSDLKLAQSSVDSAQLSLNKAKSDYGITQSQQDTAVAKAFTALLNNSDTAVPANGNVSTADLTITGNYQGTDQGQYIISIYNTGAGLYYQTSGLETSSNAIVRGQALPLGTKGLYITFSSTGDLYPSSIWTVSLPDQTASNYVSLNQSYQSAILSRQQAMANAQNSIDTATISLQNAQTQLAQKQAGSTNAQIEQAAAQLSNARAQLIVAENTYADNIITAPFDGIIAELNAKVGDQVSGSSAAAGSTNLATLITKQKIATMALNEVDVAKIKIGDKATLTFDAIDGLDMTGTVSQIDSIGTVSQGVVTYNVKITFDTDDDRIKSGMSVSADIITDAHTDVLTVPNSAVKTNAAGSYVQILKDGKPQDVTVQTGISNDTDTEITGGLTEGQSIITQTIVTGGKTSTPAATTGNAARGTLGGFGAAGGAVRVIGGAAGGR